MSKNDTQLQYIALNRANIELKFRYPCCGPGNVDVFSLAKNLTTTYGKPATSSFGQAAQMVQRGNADLLFTGEVGCCANVHLIPETIAVPISQKHNPAGANAESFRITSALCFEDEMWFIEQGCCSAEVLAHIQATRDELSAPQQMCEAADQYGNQGFIGKISDGGCGANVFSPHLQCCAQKLIMTSSLCDNRSSTIDMKYHNVMGPEKTPLCCEHPCWYESSLCCKNKTWCTWDCLGCGQSRSLRFRCCCCGEVAHTYPLFRTHHTISGKPEQINGRIVVMGRQNCCLGNISDESLLVLISPPFGTTLQEAKVLTAMAYEIGSAYLKPC